MGFIHEVVASSMDVWQQCLKHPFLQELGAGTLPREKFRSYIIDDSLYLREYARVFGWGVVKATTMEEIQTCWSMMAFINEGENATRLQYLKEFGLTQRQVEQLPPTQENYRYTQFMLQCAKDRDMGSLLMAVLPCMLSYYYLVEKLLQQYPTALAGPYGPFLKDYTGPAYLAACQSWGRTAEKACQNAPSLQKEAYISIFRQSSLHELEFWEAAYGAKELHTRDQ